MAERDDDVGATMDGAMRSRDRLAIEARALSSRVGAPEVERARGWVRVIVSRDGGGVARAAPNELDVFEVVDERGRGGGASDVDVDDAELTVSIGPEGVDVAVSSEEEGVRVAADPRASPRSHTAPSPSSAIMIPPSPTSIAETSRASPRRHSNPSSPTNAHPNQPSPVATHTASLAHAHATAPPNRASTTSTSPRTIPPRTRARFTRRLTTTVNPQPLAMMSPSSNASKASSSPARSRERSLGDDDALEDARPNHPTSRHGLDMRATRPRVRTAGERRDKKCLCASRRRDEGAIERKGD